MSERKTDHVAEAERLLTYAASPAPGSPELAANVIARAQVHATLALIEQSPNGYQSYGTPHDAEPEQTEFYEHG